MVVNITVVDWIAYIVPLSVIVQGRLPSLYLENHFTVENCLIYPSLSVFRQGDCLFGGGVLLC
jgi:hypothetical protein